MFMSEVCTNLFLHIFCFNLTDPIHGGISHWETEKKAWKHTNSDSGCPDGSCGHYTQVFYVI